MNTRFVSVVFFALCGLASYPAMGRSTPGASHQASPGASRAAQDDVQRRRADLRAAVQAQQPTGSDKDSVRQLTQRDRHELREQLRQQRRAGPNGSQN